MKDIAKTYLDAGLCVLPARLAEKRPAIGTWKEYQTRRPTAVEINAWLANGHDALCVLTGAASGHLEAMDFDMAGEVFEQWCELVRQLCPGLLERLVIERTPSGGWHVCYRGVAPICGNLKLAQRKQHVDSAEPVTICGKKYVPRKDANGQWYVLLTLIETRGEGGLILCAPSPGYALHQGNFTSLPVLTEAERESLLDAAWGLNEYVPEPVAGTATGPSAVPGEPRPGDDFNARGEVRELLLKHGWALAKGGDNEYWRRPGKDRGWSASLKDRVFYVFSSNAAPFEPATAYGPFAVYAMLEHGGDFSAAAQALRSQGFGSEPPANDVDLSAFQLGPSGATADEPEPVPVDPGPLPDRLLRVPGFISELMDYCLETAPYPNLTLAFCGALSLQAFLAGRKVRDSGDNRTNLYLLGLAHSAAGKDHPRKVNTRIVNEIGMPDCLGDRFASGEGVQDALFLNEAMLFQTDEIDGMLQSINKAKDARHENIMGTLLTMYSSANSVFPMRRKAGKEAPGVIDQPCLVIFGTAIPNHYYEALSERMLTNGFFARMIILESGQRGSGQEPTIRDLPTRVLAVAKWWSDYQPGERMGNLVDIHPVPAIVEHTDEARRVLVETREQAEAEYAKAETGNDSVGTTVWGRVSEQVRKLSLLYAISENHQEPRISLAAVQWASQFVMHQTRRMLFMAAGHVADNPFHAECLKVLEKLREAPGRELPHSVLLKRMKMPAGDFKELIQTLTQRNDIEAAPVSTPGRTGMVYRLIGRRNHRNLGEAR